MKERDFVKKFFTMLLILSLTFVQMPFSDNSFAEELKDTPNQIEGLKENYFDSITFKDADFDYLESIEEVKVDSKVLKKASGSVLWGDVYSIDAANKKIKFGGIGTDNIITVKAKGYKLLRIEVKDGGSPFGDKTIKLEKLNENVVDKKLNIRIRGRFDSALVNQKKYDAVSAATGSATANKNSDVIVEVAEGDNPQEDDWFRLNSEKGSKIFIDRSKSSVEIDAASGMVGKYGSDKGDLYLSGIPAKKGVYQVRAKITDTKGREAISNPLEFRVYNGDETLKEQLTIENSEPFGNGSNKYKWEMEPWLIHDFGTQDQTVTVPKDIKVIFGSHVSGTYGELGIPCKVEDRKLENKTKQTFIIDKDADLTLVNVKAWGSVNFVVKDGGKLSLHDSGVYGTVTVEKGGTFSMNYDAYAKKFMTGASIQGQIILEDGATIENAMIYSNVNHLADGNPSGFPAEPIIKQISAPVIKTMPGANVNIKGKVYVKGDDAPFSGKQYRGQPALEVNGGTVNVEKDGVLACFGGGYYATNSNGGPGVTVNNGGKITGEGSLIAVAGNGYIGVPGGDGIEGKGTVSTGTLFAKGGETFSSSSEAGKALGEQIKCETPAPNKKLINGMKKNIETDDDYIYQWRNITKVPNLTPHLDALKGSSAQEPQKPGQNSGGNPVVPNKPEEPANSSSDTVPGSDLKTQPDKPSNPVPGDGNSDRNSNKIIIKRVKLNKNGAGIYKKVKPYIYGKNIYKFVPAIEGKRLNKYKVENMELELPYAGKIKSGTKVYIIKLEDKVIKGSGGSVTERLAKRGKLITGIYNKKTGSVTFNVTGDLAKMKFAIAKKYI